MARMEDILEVYKRPYCPENPVLCFDETNRQLIEETRVSIPGEPGRPKKMDYEYRRNGVANIFMIFEPLQATRYIKVRERRTNIDFAYCMKDIVDVHYANAQKFVFVMDNLSTHKIGSLYDAFEPEEARRIAEKIEIHYTPKHGSWLNMAEVEIGVLAKQCLSKYIPKMEQMDSEATAWTKNRNIAKGTVNWRFTTEDARIKLKKLYPQINAK